MDADQIIENALKEADRLLANPNKLPHAEVVLKQIIRCQSDHKVALKKLGFLELRLGEQLNDANKFIEGIEILQHLIQLDSQDPDSYNMIGLCYGNIKHYDKAIKNIKKAIDLNPCYLFYNNLALQYRNLEEYPLAIEILQKSIEIQSAPQTWINLANAYAESNNLEEAKRCFQQALELDPDNLAAHVELSFVYLHEGEFLRGLREYEWRFQYYPQLKFYLETYDQSKKWDGTQDLKGKTFLIYAEQGLGDTIHFMRYIYKLKELGAERVIVHCPIPLREIVLQCKGVDQVISFDIVTQQGEELPNYDFQCSLISLPYYLNCDEMDGKPYLKTEKSLDVNSSYPNTFNIGITWAGSPAHPNDEKRSFNLKYFKPIHEIEGVKLFNLQIDMRKRMHKYGLASLDLTQNCEDMKIVNMAELIHNFDDLAGIVKGLDLVITCDTALVHLCGALGIPCWVALPYTPDWRWGFSGESTKWYDSVRLFRQDKPKDWISVFDKMKKEIDEILLSNK